MNEIGFKISTKLQPIEWLKHTDFLYESTSHENEIFEKIC